MKTIKDLCIAIELLKDITPTPNKHLQLAIDVLTEEKDAMIKRELEATGYKKETVMDGIRKSLKELEDLLNNK